MSYEVQSALEFIQLTVNRLPSMDAAKVIECANKIRELLLEYGEHGSMALALVSAEESGE